MQPQYALFFKKLLLTQLVFGRLSKSIGAAAGAAERRGLAEIRREKREVFFPLFSASLLFFSYLCEASALCGACGGDNGFLSSPAN
jgi:hypothetical protein